VGETAGWIYNLIGQMANATGPHKLYSVWADPMEQARAELTEEMLRQWAKDEVLPKLAKVDWELIFNLDETSDAPRTEAKRKKVISTQPVNTIYTSAREDGHILWFLPSPSKELASGRLLLCPQSQFTTS